MIKMKLMVMICWLGLPLAALANDIQITREMMMAIDAKDWNQARKHAAQAKDEIIPQIYAWHALRAGEGDFALYQAFLRDNADWPGLPLMQKKAEAKIPNDISADRAMAFFKTLGPQSGQGVYHFMRAHLARGDDPAVKATLIQASAEIPMNADEWEKIAALAPDLANQYMNAHIDFLLFEGMNDRAESFLENLEGQDRAQTLARIKMQRDEAGITETMATLTAASLASPGVVFDRFQYRMKHGNPMGALDLILRQSTSRAALGRPHYWSNRREDLARRLVWDGDDQTAYRVASNHFLNPDEKGFLSLEFLAGFLALEFLGDNNLARQHFLRLKNASETPISRGRAGYWLGRGGDPTGYDFAAQYQTSFYGQLAREKSGAPYDQKLINAARPTYRGQGFMQHDSIHAALVFAAADRPLLAHRFLAHESETLKPNQAEALGLLALDLKLPHAAVNIGKNQARNGAVVTHSYYPMPPLITQEIPTTKSLAYAIMRQESEFYPRAQSHVGARGLMQLMPATAQDMAARESIEYQAEKLLDDPGYNIRLGTAYLDQMLQRFAGRIPLVAVSYNAGPHRADRWQEHHGELGTNVDEVVKWIELIPFDETRNYVQRVAEGLLLYDAKLRGSWGHYTPSELLTQSFPKGKDYSIPLNETIKADPPTIGFIDATANETLPNQQQANRQLYTPPARPSP